MPRRLNAPAVRGWEDYWPIAVRRRWWIALPTFFCWATIWTASWLVPSSYESDALILVEQQKVPDQAGTRHAPRRNFFFTSRRPAAEGAAFPASRASPHPRALSAC